MDRDLRGQERRGQSGDPEARIQFVRNLIRSGRYDDIRNLVIDQSFFDLAAVNRALSSSGGIVSRNDISINLASEEDRDVIISQVFFSPPPPPPAIVLQDYDPYQYVSPMGEYGEVPYSELAMHSQAAGEQVVRYFLREREFQPGNPIISGAAVQTAHWPRVRLVRGLPGEVLPSEVRRQLGGFGSERMPHDTSNPFVMVTAEVRADTAWGTPARLRIGQLALFYYPGLGQLYWRVEYSDNNEWHEILNEATQRALPTGIRAAT